MTTRLLRHLALSSALVGITALSPLALTGCSGNGMTALEVPESGVQLGYELVPGSIFQGHVYHKRSEGSVGQNQLTRKLEFDAKMSVLNVRESDSAIHCQVEISGINPQWVIPSSPIDLDAFTANAKKKLDGMTIDLFLASNGDLVEFPEPPSDLEDEDRFLMEAVLEGLEQAFYQVPNRPLKQGESWNDESTKGRKGKLGRYYEEKTTSTFDGLFQPKDQADEKLAQLSVQTERVEMITTKAGGHETKTVDKKTVTFDADESFLKSVKGIRTKYDAGQTSRIDFNASWTLTDQVVKEETKQKISDPCDNDYVGGAVCEDPCSPNYIGDAECAPAGEAPAEGEGAAEGGDGEAAPASEEPPTDAE